MAGARCGGWIVDYLSGLVCALIVCSVLLLRGHCDVSESTTRHRSSTGSHDYVMACYGSGSVYCPY